jgi:phospholipase A1
MSHFPWNRRPAAGTLALLPGLLIGLCAGAQAQSSPGSLASEAAVDADWRTCSTTAGSAQRLACFDRWAQRQSWSAPTGTSASGTAASASVNPPVDARLPVQLSVRTKIAQGMLTQGHPTRKDSLWFGYTQQSYWQLFSPDISRPFRTTDHEPEVMYVYPTDAQLPFGWRWRYSGVGLVHQSNGQSNPLSRSWNRVYLMTGMELDNRWNVHARIWKRLPESATSDDNPGISDYIGRGEVKVFWNVDKDNTLGATVRHSLSSTGRGSARLEWLQTLGTGLGGGKSNLRLHTQLFSGYGDSMIDYNHKRTVLSLGLSLVE